MKSNSKITWENEIIDRTVQELAESCISRLKEDIGDLAETWKSGVAEEIIFWWRYIATKGSDYGPECARWVSAWSRERLFNYTHLFPDDLPQGIFNILDIGAGVVSEIGTVSPSPLTQIELVALDPLAPAYNWLLNAYGIKPPFPVSFGHGENIEKYSGSKLYNFIHAKNCLDHMYSPIDALKSMAKSLSPVPGSAILLRHWRNEAEFEKPASQWLV